MSRQRGRPVRTRGSLGFWETYDKPAGAVQEMTGRQAIDLAAWSGIGTGSGDEAAPETRRQRRRRGGRR